MGRSESSSKLSGEVGFGRVGLVEFDGEGAGPGGHGDGCEEPKERKSKTGRVEKEEGKRRGRGRVQPTNCFEANRRRSGYLPSSEDFRFRCLGRP